MTYTGSVASSAHSVRRGKVKEPSWFLPFFPDFSLFSPLFPSFWQFFRCQGWHSAPPPRPPWLRHWELVNHKLYIDHADTKAYRCLRCNNRSYLANQRIWDRSTKKLFSNPGLGNSNDKRGYQAFPWTHKKQPKHVFLALKTVRPSTSIHQGFDTLNKDFSFLNPKQVMMQ